MLLVCISSHVLHHFRFCCQFPCRTPHCTCKRPQAHVHMMSMTQPRPLKARASRAAPRRAHQEPAPRAEVVDGWKIPPSRSRQKMERIRGISRLRGQGGGVTQKMVRAGDPRCAWSQSGADQARARFLVRAIDLQGKHREPQASKGRARASLVTSTRATRFDAPRHSTKLGEIPLPTGFHSELRFFPSRVMEGHSWAVVFHWVPLVGRIGILARFLKPAT